MSGSTNFLQWNPEQNNQESDTTYASDPIRSGGAPSGGTTIFPSALANKGFYQWSTFIAALSQAMANKGYALSDANFNQLVSVLANLLTNADVRSGFVSIPWSPSPTYDLSQGTAFGIVMQGNITGMSFTNIVPGQLSTLFFVQPPAGNATVAWPLSVVGGVQPNPAPNAVSSQTFMAYAGDVLYAVNYPVLNSPSVTVLNLIGSGNYITPAGCILLHVRVVAGGGGGGGSGTITTQAGQGGNSTFGSIIANGGVGNNAQLGGQGGGALLGDINVQGGWGGSVPKATFSYYPGGIGGASAFGGGGGSNSYGTGVPGGAPGSGGAGGSASTTAVYVGGGGGAGGYAESWIAGPASQYSYTVGSGGAGGAAGTNGYAGGNGASGIIIVEAW